MRKREQALPERTESSIQRVEMKDDAPLFSCSLFSRERGEDGRGEKRRERERGKENSDVVRKNAAPPRQREARSSKKKKAGKPLSQQLFLLSLSLSFSLSSP